MSKNVLLLFSKDVHWDGRTPYRNHAPLLEKMQRGSFKIHYYYGILLELCFIYSGGGNLQVVDPRSGRDISEFDLVFFQKWFTTPQHAYAAALHLKRSQTDFFSQEVLRQNPFSKLSELVLIAQKNLPYPKTVVAPLAAYRQLALEGRLPFTYPFIIKSVTASRGANNYRVNGDEDVFELVQRHAHEDITFMAQEYISNQCDYRLTIMGGELKYILKRTASGGTHLNNTSQGGKGEFVNTSVLPDKAIQDALRAAKAVFREDFAGVDLLIDAQGQHWILEVNKSPEIQSGVNAEYKTKMLADYIASRLSSQQRPERKVRHNE